MLAGTTPIPSETCPPGQFPRFSARFFFGWDLAGSRSCSGADMHGTGGGTGQTNRPALKTLDLGALTGSKEDGPPSETQLRRQKYQFFEKQCSEIIPGLYLSGDYVAKNREIVSQHGITHVMNCVGFICKEYFQGELKYLTYFLQDTPAEDILCILYNAFEFIDTAIANGGRVLVHCSQGVSRSATVVIAYLMWKSNKSYDEAYAHVKAARGVANPNIGFTCQLLQWQKRRNAPPARMRMYRITPHCQHAPLLLVPRLVTPPKEFVTHTWRALDPRGAFVIQAPNCQYVWVGSKCPPAFAEAAEATARLLPKYEATSSSALEVYTQGQEPPQFIVLMDPPELDEDAEHRNARRCSITGDVLSTCSLTSFNEAESSQPHHSRHASGTHHSCHNSGLHSRHQSLAPFDVANASVLPSSPPQSSHHPPPTPLGRSPLSSFSTCGDPAQDGTPSSQQCAFSQNASPALPHQWRQQSSPIPPLSPPNHLATQAQGPFSHQASPQPQNANRQTSLPVSIGGSGGLQLQLQQQQQHQRREGWRPFQEGDTTYRVPPPRLSLPGGMHLPDSSAPCHQNQSHHFQTYHHLQQEHPNLHLEEEVLGGVHGEQRQHTSEPRQPKLQVPHMPHKPHRLPQHTEDMETEDGGAETQQGGQAAPGVCSGVHEATMSVPLPSPMLMSPAPVYLSEALIRGGFKDPGRAQAPSLGWTVSEVDDYTPDFELYWDAARAAHGTPGFESVRHLGTCSSMGKEQGKRAMRACMGGTVCMPSYMAYKGCVGMGGDDMLRSKEVGEEDGLLQAGAEEVGTGIGEDHDTLMSSMGAPSPLAGFFSADLADPKSHSSPRHSFSHHNLGNPTFSPRRFT